jgi:putative ABC transport system ATP-binding protein
VNYKLLNEGSGEKMKNKSKIELRNVYKIYKMGTNDVVALRRANLTVYDKEFVAIKGPSGAGKSTLLHLIGGLDKPTNGRVIVNGTDLADFTDDQLTVYRKDYIGFVFQFFNLIPTLNAIENVMVSRMFDREKGLDKAEELLTIVGLEERLNHLPSELSGGEQQRVAIARALMNDPTILLADEPTGNIDSTTGKEILKLFRKLNKNGMTIVLVTHDDEIARATKRIISIRDGKVLGTPEKRIVGNETTQPKSSKLLVGN